MCAIIFKGIITSALVNEGSYQEKIILCFNVTLYLNYGSQFDHQGQGIRGLICVYNCNGITFVKKKIYYLAITLYTRDFYDVIVDAAAGRIH